MDVVLVQNAICCCYNYADCITVSLALGGAPILPAGSMYCTDCRHTLFSNPQAESSQLSLLCIQQLRPHKMKFSTSFASDALHNIPLLNVSGIHEQSAHLFSPGKSPTVALQLITLLFSTLENIISKRGKCMAGSMIFTWQGSLTVAMHRGGSTTSAMAAGNTLARMPEAVDAASCLLPESPSHRQFPYLAAVPTH